MSDPSGGSSSESRCECCRGELTTSNSLSCSVAECSRGYIFSCVGISAVSFKKMSAAAKRSWVCPACRCAKPKGGDNSNTPCSKTDDGSVTSRNKNKTAEPRDVKYIASDAAPTEPPAWCGALEAKLTANFRALLNAEMRPLKTSCDEILSTIAFLCEKYDEINAKVATVSSEILALNKENHDLRSTVADLSTRLNLLEQHSRECNLEISCLPEHSSENLADTVTQIGKVVSCPVQESDIHMCKRVAKINSSKPRPRAVIVKFHSVSKRDSLLASVIKFNKANPRNKLNTSLLGTGVNGDQSPIYITEHLSPAAKQLHAAARIAAREKSYNKVYTRNGRIFVRKHDGAKSIHIRNMADIERL